MFDRIMGILTLKAPVYKQVAEDQSATQTAGIIVAVVTFIQGFIVGLTKTGEVDFLGGIVKGIVGLILGLIGWFVAAWLLATIAKAFGGKTDIKEMLRVTGFVSMFSLAVLLNLAGLISQSLLCVTSIIGIIILILSIIGYCIGVREAAEFSTGKAIITAILAVIGNWVITGPISSLILSLFGL